MGGLLLCRPAPAGEAPPQPAAAQQLCRTSTPCPAAPAVPGVQVIRSRDRLLDQLYNYLMALKPYEIENLMAEDPTLVKR